ncbi:MAG: TonB-dependent receptor plug domain-containing protein [Balneolaceae bacterium]|nr:TonB-dependent receptor plug domain-containing protein [Balneolaceae bacterium]
MKQLILLSLMSLSLLFAGCGSANNTAGNNNNARPEGSVSDDHDRFTSLADYLRRVPGVSVSGSGENASISVRGINSFNLSNSPLYVVDGQAVGNSYNQANRMVDPRYIDYVRVLKGPDASIYGVRGANGVIEIVTRKS